MNFPIKHSLVFTAAVFTIGLGSMAAPVFAQEEDSELDLDAVLEEVIVTAQRRAENVQDVPISMAVVSEEQIANANLSNAGDLATITPSLTVDTRFGFENTSFAIRGFYQSLRTTASVATYFADVVAPRGQTSQTSGDGAGPGYLFDLQNVQVLKGPQGTLFGRNTTGGAILLTPHEPTDVFEGYVEGTAANFDAKKLQVVVNVPITDTFKVRLGVEDNKRDGHFKNYTGIGADELGNSNYTATRLSMLWNITDELENTTIFNYVDSESNGYSSKLVACNPSAPSNFVFTGIASGCPAQLSEQAASGNDGFYDLASAINTPITTIKEKRVINTTTYDINDDLTIKNIFGYAHLETENGTSVFGTNFVNSAYPGLQYSPGSSVINPNVPVTSQETYVEEIQLQGSGFDESLTWQTGLYYENSRPDGFSGNNSAAFLYCDMASLEGDPSGFNCFDAQNGAFGGVLVQNFQTEFLNKAVFGQATYDFSDEFALTVGLRYTEDEAEGYGIKTRYTFNNAVQNTPAITSTARPKVSSEKPTGMINATYKPMEDVMTYAKYTRGYRQGSVNLAADVGLDTHEPETIDTYEIGAKTSFGGYIPGQFNIAIFDNELTDMQLQNGYVSKYSGPTTAITNAGKATVKGVEMDAIFQLTDDLTFNLSYAHLKTELEELGRISPDVIEEILIAGTGDPEAAAFSAGTFTPIAIPGDELPNAPKNTWVATLNYMVPVPSDVGVVSLGTTYVYIGAQRTAATGASYGDNDMLPKYELLNLNASWMSIYSSDFDLSLFVTNALDKEYVTYNSGTFNTLGFESSQTGMPRMYGARVRYNFGEF